MFRLRSGKIFECDKETAVELGKEIRNSLLQVLHDFYFEATITIATVPSSCTLPDRLPIIIIMVVLAIEYRGG